jgi:hypothetical protein
MRLLFEGLRGVMVGFDGCGCWGLGAAWFVHHQRDVEMNLVRVY